MQRPAHQIPLCDTGHIFALNALQAGSGGGSGRAGGGAGVHAAFHVFQVHVPFVSGAVHAAEVLCEKHGGGGGGGSGGGGGMLQCDEFQMHGLRQWPLSLTAGHGGGGGGAGPIR